MHLVSDPHFLIRQITCPYLLSTQRRQTGDEPVLNSVASWVTPVGPE